MTDSEKRFLKLLDQEHNRQIYVKITSLTNDDTPMEVLEGRATSGSINIDGKSAVRRSCSLSLVVLENDYSKMITDTYWCYNCV